MTYEEAINELNDSKRYVPSTVINPLGSLWNDAIELAVEAIEKKIPKKPTEKYNLVNCVIDWRCPSCGRFHRNDYPLEYCSHCGQAIDWSEEE